MEINEVRNLLHETPLERTLHAAYGVIRCLTDVGFSDEVINEIQDVLCKEATRIDDKRS